MIRPIGVTQVIIIAKASSYARETAQSTKTVPDTSAYDHDQFAIHDIYGIPTVHRYPNWPKSDPFVKFFTIHKGFLLLKRALHQRTKLAVTFATDPHLTSDATPSQPKRYLTPFLPRDIGIDISAGQISHILLDGHEAFHEEKDQLLPAARELSDHLHCDDTSSRHQGKAAVCTHLGNELFASFTTTDSKSRLNFLRLLCQPDEQYHWCEEAVEALRALGVSKKLMAVMENKREGVWTGREAWQQHLKAWRLKPREQVRVSEAALCGTLLMQPWYSQIGLVSDDAPQFKLFGLIHGLCWVHGERKIDCPTDGDGRCPTDGAARRTVPDGRCPTDGARTSCPDGARTVPAIIHSPRRTVPDGRRTVPAIFHLTRVGQVSRLRAQGVLTMPRPTRSEQFHAAEIGIVHTVQRCVRRAFLAGVDDKTGKDFSFRREWIRRRMESLASVFGIDVLTYAIIENQSV